MSSVRAQLQGELQLFLTDTFSHMKALKSFMEESEELLQNLQSTEEQMDQMGRVSPVAMCWKKKGLCCYCVPCSKREEGEEDNCLCCCCSCSSLEERKRRKWTNQLNEAVKYIQQQLKKLKRPLQAIERLAVTSEHVFEKDPLEQVDLRTVNLRAVCRVLSAVKAMSPWVIVLKQAEIFKAKTGEPQTPNPNENIERPQNVNSNEGIELLHETADRSEITTSAVENVEALQLRLQTLICALRNICCLLKDSALMEICVDQSEVHVSEELSEERAAQMLSLVQELKRLREDEDSRLVCLLRGDLVDQLRERVPQMKFSLTVVRDCAEKMTRMHTCSLASGAVCSSLTALGGVVSLIGLGLESMPKVSSIMLLIGLITSGITGVLSLIMMLIFVCVNRTLKTEANGVCEQVRGHMKALQRSLTSATFSPRDRIPPEDQTRTGCKIGSKVALVRTADLLFDLYTKVTAAEVLDIQQVALHGPWFKSIKSFVISIMSNLFFLIVDCVIIGINVHALRMRRKPAAAQWLRARASLWAAEVETWTQIFKSLEKGQPQAQRNIQLIHKPFY